MSPGQWQASRPFWLAALYCLVIVLITLSAGRRTARAVAAGAGVVAGVLALVIVVSWHNDFAPVFLIPAWPFFLASVAASVIAWRVGRHADGHPKM